MVLNRPLHSAASTFVTFTFALLLWRHWISNTIGPLAGWVCFADRNENEISVIIANNYPKEIISAWDSWMVYEMSGFPHYCRNPSHFCGDTPWRSNQEDVPYPLVWRLVWLFTSSYGQILTMWTTMKKGAMILLMVQKSVTTTWDAAKTLKIMGHLPNLNWCNRRISEPSTVQTSFSSLNIFLLVFGLSWISWISFVQIFVV